MSNKDADNSVLRGLLMMGLLALFPGVRRAIGFLALLLFIVGTAAFLICGSGRDDLGFPIMYDPHVVMRVGAGLAWIGAVMTFSYWAGSHFIELVGARLSSRSDKN